MFRVLLLLLAVFPAPAAEPQERADDRYQYVAGLFEKGLHELTVKEAEKLIRDEPRHGKVDTTRYRLAASLFELGKKEEAAAHLRPLAEKPGFDLAAEASFRLAQCEIAANRDAPAAKALERVLSLKKDYLRAPAAFLLGEIAFRKGDDAAAEARYAEALAAGAEKELARDTRLRLAWCSYRRSDPKRCLERVDEFLRAHPGDEREGEARYLAGEAHLEAGRGKEALDAFRAVTKGAFVEAALRGVGFSHAKLNDGAAAAKAFADLLARFPEGRYAGEAALQCAVHRLKAGDAAGALSALATRKDADDPEVASWRARAELAAGNADGALAGLDRALRAARDDASKQKLETVRGEVLVAAGRWGEAAGALSASGTDFGLHAAAVAALNAGKPAEAARLAKQFLEKHPQSAYRLPVLLALGEAQLAEKKWPDAEKAFGDALTAGAAGADRARALSGLGWCRYRQDDPKGAAVRFDECVAANPAAAQAEEARYMTGRCRETAGDAEGAANAWRASLKAHPTGAHRIETLVGLSRVEPAPAAIDRLRAAIEAEPTGPQAGDALASLAEKLEAAGRADEAEAAHRTLAEKLPKHPRAAAARYALAWRGHERGNPDEARPWLEAVERDASAPPDLAAAALELRVFCERKAGKPDAAAEAFRKLRERNASEERLLSAARAVAAAWREAKKPQDAEKLLEPLLGSLRDPKSRGEIAAELAVLAVERGDPEGAARRLDSAKADASAPKASAEARFRIGEALFEKGDDAGAARSYQLAASAEGSAVADRALYKEGFAWLRAGDPAKAAERFGQLVDAHPKSELRGESLYLRGEALFRADRMEEAADALERARKEAADHETAPKALFRLGVARARLERWRDAAATLSDLARRYPEFEQTAEAELWRGRALATTGDPRGARAALERTIAKDRGSLAARARIELGKIHRAGGDLEAALAEFLKVATLYASGPEVAEGLLLAGECLESKGDREQAQRLYREVIEKHSSAPSASVARDRLAKRASR